MTRVVEFEVVRIHRSRPLVPEAGMALGETLKGGDGSRWGCGWKKHNHSTPQIERTATIPGSLEDGGALRLGGTGGLHFGHRAVAVGAGLAGRQRHPVRPCVLPVATRAGGSMHKARWRREVQSDVPHLGRMEAGTRVALQTGRVHGFQ